MKRVRWGSLACDDGWCSLLDEGVCLRAEQSPAPTVIWVVAIAER